MGLPTFLPTTTDSPSTASTKTKHSTKSRQDHHKRPKTPTNTRQTKHHHTSSSSSNQDTRRRRHKTPPKQSSNKPSPTPKNIISPNYHQKPPKQQPKKQNQPQSQPQSSWDQFKNLLSCKQVEGSRVHDPSKINNTKLGSGRSSSSCSSMCSFRDVVHGNTRVVHRADSSSHSPESSSVVGHDENRSLVTRRGGGHGSSSSRSLGCASMRSTASNTNGGGHESSAGSSSGVRYRGMGMPLGKFSGCYECRMIVDPSRYPIIPRSTVSACPQCGEIFPKVESLEHHQAVRHAVSELGPEDSGRSIVEIIFKSSWLKKDNPICKIERILKVHNTQRTIQRFEDCRDAVKLRANNNITKKDSRCAADGNELLRFHCTSLSCALGARGSSSLCGSVPGCGVCTIIRHGFQANYSNGVTTTASSGRAHDSLLNCTDGRKAMLVCRVIAGRVRRISSNNNNNNDAAGTALDEDGHEDGGSHGSSSLSSPAENTAAGPPGSTYDSLAGSAGIYSNLEELAVFNPKAILPCFVVIYKTMNIN